jgi:hypothetical protein
MEGFPSVNRGLSQFLTVQAIVHQGQKNHAGEAQENASEENGDGHAVTPSGLINQDVIVTGGLDRNHSPSHNNNIITLGHYYPIII